MRVRGYVWLVSHVVTGVVDLYFDLVSALPQLGGDPDHIKTALSFYPANTTVGGDNRPMLAALVGDMTMICPTRRLARALTAAAPDNSSSPVYVYHFAHQPSCGLYPPSWGVYHTAELPFVFAHTTMVPPACEMTADEAQLAKMVGMLWRAHAATGDPSASGLRWPLYDAQTDADLVLDLELSVETAYRSAFCDFWDSVTLH